MLNNPLELWQRERFNPFRLFDELMAPITNGGLKDLERKYAFTPACNIEETGTHYLLTFDLPGVSKDQVKIEVSDSQLRVSGERKEEKKESSKSRHLYERFEGRFERVFGLPSSIDAEKIEGTYENGVLRIAIPKASAAKAREVKITEGKRVA